MGCDTDVFVVGGGPAGLAAAIAARRKGFRVTVADGAKPPISKACGEGLLPDALAALRQLGVELREKDGRALRGIEFEDDHSRVSARFPKEHGLGVRREILHQRMTECAEECGVLLRWNTPVTAVQQDRVVSGGENIRARWIIGADGSGSRVRRWSGLDSFGVRRSRFAFRVHYRLEPWSDFTEIHWADDAQAYVTPVGPREICIVLISKNQNLRFTESLLSFPQLAGRLKGAARASAERGALTSMVKLRRVYRGHVGLIGDASGSVDAITAEGLSLSFRQASALADALEAGDLGHYQRAHQRLSRRPWQVGNLLLLLGRQTGLRQRTMRSLKVAPQLFERLLAYQMGETRPLELASAGAVFSWRFLAA
jgi:menaquinone-9 beta-reductase